MQDFNQPEPQRILAAGAIIGVLIVILAWRLNTMFGVILLPFGCFGVIMAVVRISAPWYMRKKALSFIKKNGGRTPLESLTAHLTPVTRPGVDQEEVNRVVADFIQHMHEQQVIRIQPDDTVVQGQWSR